MDYIIFIAVFLWVEFIKQKTCHISFGFRFFRLKIHEFVPFWPVYSTSLSGKMSDLILWWGVACIYTLGGAYVKVGFAVIVSLHSYKSGMIDDKLSKVLILLMYNVILVHWVRQKDEFHLILRDMCTEVLPHVYQGIIRGLCGIPGQENM